MFTYNMEKHPLTVYEEHLMIAPNRGAHAELIFKDSGLRFKWMTVLARDKLQFLNDLKGLDDFYLFVLEGWGWPA